MKEVKRVDRAVNDATLNQAGNVYQYLVALKDCYELMEGDTLQIEVNGDVSVINKNKGTPNLPIVSTIILKKFDVILYSFHSIKSNLYMLSTE